MKAQAFACPQCKVITLVADKETRVIECPNCSCKIRSSYPVKLQPNP